MRTLLTLVLCASLSGCCTPTPTPNVVRIPDLPANLQLRAAPLPKLIDPTMAAQTNDSVNTDMKYNAVATQLNQVLTIYDCIKVAVNEQKNMKECLK